MPSLHGRLRDFLGVRAGYVPTPKPPRARAEAASQSPPPTLRDEQRPTAKPAEQPASASPRRRRRPVRRSQSLARLRAAREATIIAPAGTDYGTLNDLAVAKAESLAKKGERVAMAGALSVTGSPVPGQPGMEQWDRYTSMIEATEVTSASQGKRPTTAQRSAWALAGGDVARRATHSRRTVARRATQGA
ncbi:MAG TPA: hypothetical protein VER10_00025 [Mycobacterium sp.]|nr:hypothetical protein [Mycobacterium sp.]HYQ34255.1 hypothetical protein [Mycobacterium sp.]